MAETKVNTCSNCLHRSASYTSNPCAFCQPNLEEHNPTEWQSIDGPNPADIEDAPEPKPVRHDNCVGCKYEKGFHEECINCCGTKWIIRDEPEPKPDVVAELIDAATRCLDNNYPVDASAHAMVAIAMMMAEKRGK